MVMSMCHFEKDNLVFIFRFFMACVFAYDRSLSPVCETAGSHRALTAILFKIKEDDSLSFQTCKKVVEFSLLYNL